jgi:hypothetical protein
VSSSEFRKCSNCCRVLITTRPLQLIVLTIVAASIRHALFRVLSLPWRFYSCSSTLYIGLFSNFSCWLWRPWFWIHLLQSIAISSAFKLVTTVQQATIYKKRSIWPHKCHSTSDHWWFPFKSIQLRDLILGLGKQSIFCCKIEKYYKQIMRMLIWIHFFLVVKNFVNF